MVVGRNIKSQIWEASAFGEDSPGCRRDAGQVDRDLRIAGTPNGSQRLDWSARSTLAQAPLMRNKAGTSVPPLSTEIRQIEEPPPAREIRDEVGFNRRRTGPRQRSHPYCRRTSWGVVDRCCAISK